nr:MAG TPA: hypothetical protein [Caudoviricetes sp.]DAU62736.1 MAG TPA: hypothetical protein [Caudoviricetes sp.]
MSLSLFLIKVHMTLMQRYLLIILMAVKLVSFIL